MSDIEQEQIRNSRFYTDTQAAGAGMETPPATDPFVEWDLNNLRSQINRLYDGTGSGDWFQDIAAAGFDNFGIKQIHDKKLFYVDPFDTAVQQVVLGAAAAGVLVDASLVSRTPKILAVLAASTATGGVAAAPEPNFTVAGTLGVGLTQLVDSGGIVLNKVDIIDDSTNDPPLDGGAVVFGLAQTINGTGDGTAIAAALSENLQISFVKVDPGTNAVVSVSLPAGTYNYNFRRCTNLFNLPPGGLIAGAGALPDVIDPGTQLVRLPWREYDISAPGAILGPAANDPVNVTTGVFTTAGAQTGVASFGTPALPANGNDFRDDNRIKIWRNGVLQSKQQDVIWVSTTQFYFAKRLFVGERTSWEMPSSY